MSVPSKRPDLNVFILVSILLATASAFPNHQIVTADSLFSLRNTNFDSTQLLADTVYVNQAIRLYMAALEKSESDSVKTEALWKLLRAYYFKGQFGTVDKDEKQDIYKRGIDIGEAYLSKLPEAVELYAWQGIMWARWAEVSGTLAAALKGVAGKVKNFAEKTIVMDAAYLDAGGYRMLGMLHFSVPKVPFVLTWPSDEKAVEYLTKAYEMAPKNLYNKYYLAQVLYDQGEREQAITLLNDIVNQATIVHDLAIDSYIKTEAEHFMKEHDISKRD